MIKFTSYQSLKQLFFYDFLSELIYTSAFYAEGPALMFGEKMLKIFDIRRCLFTEVKITHSKIFVWNILCWYEYLTMEKLEQFLPVCKNLNSVTDYITNFVSSFPML